MHRLDKDFFRQDVLVVAPALLGKKIGCSEDGHLKEYMITETEAYRGEDDLACHASKGRTKRTEIMYHEGGYVYVYLIYGMYWMINIVTGQKDDPQAVLIRGVKDLPGPGKVGKALGLDKSYYGEDLITSSRIWLTGTETRDNYTCTPRINIDYAGEPWRSKPWRFVLNNL